MSVVIQHRFVEAISKSKDARKEIMEFIGDLSHFEVFGDRVLIASYMRPEKTAGGIIRPDSNKNEDIWQNKVGLVLKWGPDAFRDENGELYEQVVNVGEWGVFFIGDGKPLQLNDAPCRLVKSANFVGKTTKPEKVL